MDLDSFVKLAANVRPFERLALTSTALFAVVVCYLIQSAPVPTSSGGPGGPILSAARLGDLYLPVMISLWGWVVLVGLAVLRFLGQNLIAFALGLRQRVGQPTVIDTAQDTVDEGNQHASRPAATIEDRSQAEGSTDAVSKPKPPNANQPPGRPSPSSADSTEAYLNMIQAVVSRMASASSSTKAWSISAATAIYAFAIDKSRWDLAVLAIVPTLLFFALDAYYLGIERDFRHIFNDYVSKRARNAIEKSDEFRLTPPDGHWHRMKTTAVASISFSVAPLYLLIVASAVCIAFWLRPPTGP